jgi:hypothetical protein
VADRITIALPDGRWLALDSETFTAAIAAGAELMATTAQGGPAVSAVVDDEIIGCGGIVVQSATIGFLWGAISQDAGPHFIHLHRAARRLLEGTRLARIEAVTEIDFPEGRRWLELLGFECECPMSEDGPNGEDHYRYAWTRVREALINYRRQRNGYLQQPL